MKIAAVIQESTASTTPDKSQKTHKCIEGIKGKLNVDIFHFKGNDESVIKKINSDLKDYDYIHILKSGDIVYPDFYNSTSVTLEYSKRDYCFGHSYSVEKCELESSPVNPCQFMVKRWVLEELEMCCNFKDLYKRITEQYQGSEVPVILVLS